MITKEFMDNFVAKFKECYDLDNKWNQILFNTKDEEDLEGLFYQRSKEFRDAFILEEELINELKTNIHEDLSPEEADILFDALMNLYFNAYDDFIVMEIILLPLYEYYKKTLNFDRLIPVLHTYAYEESDFYLEANKTGNEESLRFFYEIFNFQSEYPNINSKEARLCFFKAYNNLLTTSNELIKTDIVKYFQIRQRAIGFWNSNIVQKLDGNDVDFHYFIDRLASIFFISLDVEALPEKVVPIVEFTLNKYKTNRRIEDSNKDTIELIKKKLDYRKRLITIEELFNSMVESYNRNYNIVDFNNIKDNTIDYVENCDSIMHDIFNYYEYSDKNDNIKDKFYEILYKHGNLLTTMPYNFYTQEMNHALYEFYQLSHKHIRVYEKKFEYLLEVLLYRQPITCIHSIMVRNISEAISKKVMDKKPELFIGALGTNNLEDVINNKDKILDFVSKSALLHDVGKSTCVNIINAQTRRLDNREFMIIKEHPASGRKVLCNDPDFEDYYDIMEGHHKFYNGSFGYPSNFDNRKSKNKFIIDIVSIADSTDAATDVLGRNYVNGKTFNKLLGELKKESGIRYNPDIVDLISNDEELINTLSNITTNGRLDVYKFVYNKFIKK